MDHDQSIVRDALVGVFVAERGDQPMVGYSALAFAGLLLLATILPRGHR